ncbi:hypothetical protein HNY73_014145 [Argiope bruennichi]|uniref:Uncharacterized protein n=1 Tax=Argiope bruennichi TaxID=94029 RepID=A0A8T0ETA4_ARGBR|nr:hypothetical protein HNY73_014145 [Argiope bruennichi]
MCDCLTENTATKEKKHAIFKLHDGMLLCVSAIQKKVQWRNDSQKPVLSTQPILLRILAKTPSEQSSSTNNPCLSNDAENSNQSTLAPDPVTTRYGRTARDIVDPFPWFATVIARNLLSMHFILLISRSRFNETSFASIFSAIAIFSEVTLKFDPDIEDRPLENRGMAPNWSPYQSSVNSHLISLVILELD